MINKAYFWTSRAKQCLVLLVVLTFVYSICNKLQVLAQSKASLNHDLILAQTEPQNSHQVSVQRTPVPGNMQRPGNISNRESNDAVPDENVAPSVISSAVLQEPLSSIGIEVMEHNLSKFPRHDHIIQIAALLYRYGRPKGKNILKQQLDETLDPTATAILAMNREGDSLKQIIKALQVQLQRAEALQVGTEKEESLEELPVDLSLRPTVFALAGWDDSRITSALTEAYRHYPDNPYLALALAKHNVVTDVERMQQIYSRLAPDDPRKASFAVALVHLGADRNGVLLAALIRRLEVHRLMPPFQHVDAPIAILDAFELLEDEKIAPAAAKVLDSYIKNPEIFADKIFDGTVPLEFVVRIAELLSHINKDKILTTKLLLKINKLNPNEPPDNWSPQSRVARALLEGGNSSNLDVVRKTMGEQWQKDETSRRVLKPIPEFLLSVDSQFITTLENLSPRS